MLSAKRTPRYPGTEELAYNDQIEHYHLVQKPLRPPSPSPTASMGDHGHFHNAASSTPSLLVQTAGLRYGSPGPGGGGGGSPLLTAADSSSLTVNYLPTKFGAGLVSRKRYGKELSGMHKQGGGREAFKANESRMPGTNDEDYDGVQGAWFGHGMKKPTLRWTKFKWIMFAGNVMVRSAPLVHLSVPILNT